MERRDDGKGKCGAGAGDGREGEWEAEGVERLSREGELCKAGVDGGREQCRALEELVAAAASSDEGSSACLHSSRTDQCGRDSMTRAVDVVRSGAVDVQAAPSP